MLPEKSNVLGTPDDLRARRRAARRPRDRLGADIARELGIDLVAGSIAERAGGPREHANTCVHVGPDGEIRATTARSTCSTSRSPARVYRESDTEEPGDEIVLADAADGAELGLTICYDLRFPELYRILAVRGARDPRVPAAFTLATTRDHWEVLLRARAIEDQVLRGRRQPGRRAPAGHALRRALDDRRPLGRGARAGARRRGLRRSPTSTSTRQDEIRASCPSLANRRPRPTRGPRRRPPDGPAASAGAPPTSAA